MNSAIAGTPVSKKDRRQHAQATHIFTTEGVVSFSGLVDLLKDSGLTLNRVHQKSAKGQLMFIFERGTPQITDAQSTEIVQSFLGSAKEQTGGYTFVATLRKNAPVAGTSDVHKGVPEHYLISCKGATPRIGTEQKFYLNVRQKEMLKGMPQLRLALNDLDAGLIDLIPSWVEVR